MTIFRKVKLEQISLNSELLHQQTLPELQLLKTLPNLLQSIKMRLLRRLRVLQIKPDRLLKPPSLERKMLLLLKQLKPL